MPHSSEQLKKGRDGDTVDDVRNLLKTKIPMNMYNTFCKFFT